MNKETTTKILHETRDIYNSIAPEFSDTRGKWWQPPFEFGQTARDGMKVLDLGCGNGRFAELFRGREIEYLGIDNSEELIKICRERFAGEQNINFEIGDIVSPPFQGGDRGGFESHDNRAAFITSPWPLLGKEGKFDLVLMIAVLHHLPSRDLRLQVLKNVYEALAPGGKLIMRNWNLFNCKTAKQYYKRLLDLPHKISRGIWSIKDAFIPWKPLGNKNLRYVHSFTKGEMKQLLAEAGFKEIDQYYESYSSAKQVSIWKGYNLVSIAVK